MNLHHFANAIARISATVQTNTIQEEKLLKTLHQKLASSLINAETENVTGNNFSFQTADAFSAGDLSNERTNYFQSIVQEALEKNEKPTQRVFVRDVPVRSAQLQTSVPSWAAGSTPEQTLGPFTTIEGRKLWYDFYSFQELVALYIQGEPNPVLLFHTSVFRKVFENLPFISDPATSYRLSGNTIWIYSQMLTPSAPPNSYTGLRINGGSLSFSEAPQNLNNHITLSSNAVLTLQLQLEQPEAGDADEGSDYGKDARAASLRLPLQFNFRYSIAIGLHIDEIANAACNLYGSDLAFSWNPQFPVSYNQLLKEILVPFTASQHTFAVRNNLSSFNTFSGEANIQWSAWALPVAEIDINNPTTAEGIGALTIFCSNGIFTKWLGLNNGDINLTNPIFQLSVDKISVIDFASIGLFAKQQFVLWKDHMNPHYSSVDLLYNSAFPFIFLTDVSGYEIIAVQTSVVAHIDRPVTVNAQPLNVQSKNSFALISASAKDKLLYLYDDNILEDNSSLTGLLSLAKPISFALENAVFKTTQTNGCVLFGELAEDFIHVDKGNLLLSFGLYGYLPILPDPYAANLGILQRQFNQYRGAAGIRETASGGYGCQIWMWLVSAVTWEKETEDTNKVNVSFYFAPLSQQTQIKSSTLSFHQNTNKPSPVVLPQIINPSFINEFSGYREVETNTTIAEPILINTGFQTEMAIQGLPDYQSIWNDRFSTHTGMFSLLDVSSHANQMGVSFQVINQYDRGNNDVKFIRNYNATAVNNNAFPFQVKGMNVVSQNSNVQAFTLPQVSWEPVINLTKPEKAGDPPLLFNYYPDDGGATKIFTSSVHLVPIAPIPATHSLIETYRHEQEDKIAALFTLPFGLRAFAELSKTDESQAIKPAMVENRPHFENRKLRGGIQFKITGGSSGNPDVSNQFHGVMLQVNNVLNLYGSKTDASTLGYDVTTIVNDEFYDKQGGVPLTRFDISGYGASIFSNWQNKDAEFATTSQAQFEIFVGRTAHEVIQVKSVLYPWGIHVVRTISLFRTGSGYEYRYHSGWKAESDGKFDFRFHVVTNDTTDPKTQAIVSPYEIHPGAVKGLFNIKNIVSAVDDIAPFKTAMDITGFYEFNAFNKFIYPYSGAASPVDIDLEPVYFDADIEIENTVQGQVNGRVPSKKIVGFVQAAPTGIPLTAKAFQQLLTYQNNSIGGPLNCIIDIGLNGQQMRVNRIDVNNSVDASNTNPVFVAAARGNVILPKEGSWSMVTHLAATGEVVPLPQGVTVPLIRIGKIDDNLHWTDTDLLRIANPTELLRTAGNDTVNFGYLQSTNTQKVLFLTPAYQKLADAKTVGKLLSKTPPLFADAYHIMNAKGIFPNIGNAVDKFGDVVALTQNFASNAILDGGKQVLELMQINLKDAEGKLLQEGYKLLKQAQHFDLPDSNWYLINTSFLKIYIEYKAAVRNENDIAKKPDGSPDYGNSSNFNNAAGLLNFDVDSFAANSADTWMSKLNNLAMVVDLGPLTRLVTIKGNFNSHNGSEAAYQGNDTNADFATPQIQFSEALDVVMDILQILVELQGGDYAAAMKKGLKVAMSNSADSWQYKFAASQEIPLVQFPSDIVAGASAPLKLAASLKLGVYFNESLKVTTDPSQLLPTAGAFVDFYGKLSVMCVSLEAATIYAVGSVDLTIAADTGKGPSMDMKFGFGAQLVVGLPVVGNVSVLYMVGIAIYYDSTTLTVTASMLFQGNADLLGGIVNITITIEAQGSISRNSDTSSTTCEAQVTFAIDISICFVIDIDFSTSWSEQRQIA